MKIFLVKKNPIFYNVIVSIHALLSTIIFIAIIVLELLQVLRRAIHYLGTSFKLQYEYEHYTTELEERNKKTNNNNNYFNK